MKPQLRKLPFPSNSSFLYNRLNCDYFSNPWHFHEEYELLLIDKSTGTRLIGDNVSHFADGNLSLIGSNIPHLFRNSEEYYSRNSKLNASSIVIHFTRDFLGSQFFDIPEMKSVQRLLEKSSRALEIHGMAKKYTIQKLHDMYSEKPQQRLLSLLEILIKLSQSRELKPLLSMGYYANNSDSAARINHVFDFIMRNYTQEIYVHEVASELNMSVASFSRYFKRHTRKTFSAYVTEIRIGHACKLLIEDNYSISEISFQSGFDNLSNFYRHFRKIIGTIPKEYRNRFTNVL